MSTVVAVIRDEVVLEECGLCAGTTVHLVDDGDGYMDEVECHRCINGWVDSAGERPTRELAKAAWHKANPKAREY